MTVPVKRISDQVEVLIANGQSVSGDVNLAGRVPCGVYVPASFAGVTLTFEASIDGATFSPVYKDGAAYAVTVGAGQYVYIDYAVFFGVFNLRITSSASQTADRTLALMIATDSKA